MPDQSEKQDLLLNLPLDVIPTLFQNRSQDIGRCTDALVALANTIHLLNAKWWHFDENNIPTRNKGEAIALMHSELSEALEGIRTDKQDEHLPEFKNEVVEFADCIIRILDFCAGFDLPIGHALFAKLEYNASRADHKLENRIKDGGKKF